MTSPTPPIRFVGYTNDARGTRFGVFTVTNVHPRQIDYSVSIEFKEGTSGANPRRKRLACGCSFCFGLRSHRGCSIP